MPQAEAATLRHAAVNHHDHHDHSDDLKKQLSERIEQATTLDGGFSQIASAFSAFQVTVERITMIRGSQQFELPINEHASGILRKIEGQANDLTITVVCTTTLTPEANGCLQALLTLAAITAQRWTGNLNALTSDANSKMLGNSAQMRELQLAIKQAARSIHNTLLRGESGTGKTTAAAMIHEQSSRADQPFIDLNCATLPEALLESELFGHEKGAFTGATSVKKGLFEIAAGGTLFLDEIGELRSELQAKLLTAIEQKKIRRLGGTKDIQCDLRIISASSRNLQRMVAEGTFREDLLYRIAVLEINIVPLRERPADITTLVHSRLRHEQLLTQRPTPFQINDDALKTLMFYDWPGNIRQLQNIISRLTARLEDDSPITAEDVTSQLPLQNMEDAIILPMSARVVLPGETLRAYINRVQMLIIDETIAATGTQGQAAIRLDYARTSLVILKQRIQKSLNTTKRAPRKSRTTAA
jgi:transcriptional regulator with PAS, ATPase and Fis domain